MTKDNFLEVLEKGASSPEAKIECIQFFIDNYPVFANGANRFVRGWTSMKGIKITSGSRGLVNYAFEKLQIRLPELRNFK